MVSDQIIKVLDNLCDKFGLAIDWSSKNVQPYLKELMAKCVNYTFAIDVVWLCVAILLLVAGIILLTMGLKIRKKHNYWDDTEFAFVIFSVLAFGATILICIFAIPEMIACKTFPEKVIIDMARSYLQ